MGAPVVSYSSCKRLVGLSIIRRQWENWNTDMVVRDGTHILFGS